MNLARHSISSTSPVHIFDARFDPDSKYFTASTPAGFAIYQTWPLRLVRKRELSGGTLAAAVPLHSTNLLFLLGGGRSPLYPPNKVILWDDALGAEVAELEFRERVRGLVCRRGWLAVALRRRVAVFEIGEQVSRYAEWDTCDNPRGLLAISTKPHSTLLAIPGRQIGHIQLINLPPCPPPGPIGQPFSFPSSHKSHKLPTKHAVSIIAAHTSALNTISLPPSGRLVATTSSRGTLVRIWDTITGKLVRELRRGTDKAEIYGVSFRPDEREVCVWSDKGTVHIFTLMVTGASNRQSTFSPLTPFLPLPKYFESEWSYAQYRIPVQSSHLTMATNPAIQSPVLDPPDEERCVVGWIQCKTEAPDAEPISEHQLVALTFTGGWYRLSLPQQSIALKKAAAGLTGSPPRALLLARPRTLSGSSFRSEKGKEKETHHEVKGRRTQCVLEEFRRYGRWDGWG
ncbi:hypothetical protein AMATHDRAFT_59172 [Amanita thiersii Skay4041]|uniref:Uncharacterized protein n=1 Tax=Amanita thiersii Skay4041 TaxID=703135 RepID=A0A2A9NUT4_9AGAR|nr:hypothetical protein AMATHDRAFT_59172 [Amanita thiersii Skay4041]